MEIPKVAETGKYYYDNVEENKLDVVAVEDGFWDFFHDFLKARFN